MVRYSYHACLKEIVAVCSNDILPSGHLHYQSKSLNYKCDVSPVPKHHAKRVLQGKGNKLKTFFNSELSKCDLLTSRFGLGTHWIASIKLRPLCSRGKIPWYTMDSGIYYIRNQQDATLAVSFISHCKITVHVSDTFCVHNREYYEL